MQFTNNANINGTSLRGCVTTTYDVLVATFGAPDFGPNDMTGDKVTCEWCIQFEDGTVATIYEWKNGYTPMDRAQWNIGGKSDEAVTHVINAVRQGVPA